MKYENIEIIELCPLVFVSQEDLDRVSTKGIENKGRLLPFFKADRVVDYFLNEKNIKNVYADCNVDNMVEVRGLENPYEIMEIFKLCKANFKEVKLGVYLDDFITVNGDDMNLIELDSEEEFWPKISGNINFSGNTKLDNVKVGDKIAIVANHSDIKGGDVDYARGTVEKITLKLITLNVVGKCKPVTFKKKRILSVNK